VAQLQEKGINVTLNIVGFAIDDDATESQFAEWAEAGGGEPVTLDRQEPSDRSEGRENRILAGLNRTCEQARRHG